MKCLDNNIIQAYIDNRVSDDVNEEIQEHISSCISCSKKIQEQRALIDDINEALLILNEEPDSIPKFHIPASKKKVSNTARIKTIIKVASAACILAIVLILFQEKEEQVISYVYFDLEDEYDANLTFIEQDYSYTIINSDGTINQFPN